MTPTERAHVWQRHINEWQASGVSGSAYCKQQSLVYHQFVYWRRKLAPTEDSLEQEQTVTGFTRVVSVPGASIGEAEEKFKWPKASDELMPLTGEQINWLLDGYDIALLKGHKTLHYEAVN